MLQVQWRLCTMGLPLRIWSTPCQQKHQPILATSLRNTRRRDTLLWWSRSKTVSSWARSRRVESLAPLFSLWSPTCPSGCGKRRYVHLHCLFFLVKLTSMTKLTTPCSCSLLLINSWQRQFGTAHKLDSFQLFRTWVVLCPLSRPVNGRQGLSLKKNRMLLLLSDIMEDGPCSGDMFTLSELKRTCAICTVSFTLTVNATR